MYVCVCVCLKLLQQVFLYIKWFHWILSVFIGYNEQVDLMGKL
jgi:hypothetical protein